MVATVAVGTDGSETASRAVDAAVELARRYGAQLVLLSAIVHGHAPLDRPGASAEVQWAFNPAARVREILERTREHVAALGIECRTLVGDGRDPADVLVELAQECRADVLVIGNRGMHHRLLGSVPNTVTHRAPCSVLLVKTV